MIYAASAPAIECGFVLIELIGIQTVHMCKFPYFSSKKKYIIIKAFQKRIK